MRSGSGHPGRRRRVVEPSAQPGLPEGEARLLSVQAQGGVVIIRIESGVEYELAPESVPPGVQAGRVVPADVHRAIALAHARKRAARRLFSLLARRLQPVARLRQRLIDDGFPPEAVDPVLDAMQREDVHSDRRYAEAYCRDCLLSRAVGPGYLEAKLREQGLTAAVAQEAARSAVPPDREADLAQQAAAARWRRLGAVTDLRDVARVVRYLRNRGFAAGVANTAARQTRPPAPDDAGTGEGNYR